MKDKAMWGGLLSFKAISQYPVLPCPYCNKKYLVLDMTSFSSKPAPMKENAVVGALSKEVQNTFKNARTGNVWDVAYAVFSAFDLAQYTFKKFISFFVCSNCSEHVAAIGTSKVHNQKTSETSIKIEYFSPPIHMFELKETIPKSINQELLQSFNHFHSDLSSCGAKLRRAIERLCKELGCKKARLNGMLDELQASYPKESKWLGTLKLIGNEATHSHGIDAEDLLDAFEVFDFVLNIFENKLKEDQLEIALAAINKKHNKPPQ